MSDDVMYAFAAGRACHYNSFADFVGR